MSDTSADAAAQPATDGTKDTAAKTADAKTADAKTTAAAETAAAEQKETPKKEAKSFTKADLDAEVKKAIIAAQKKWDDEKDMSELERLKKQNEELQSSIRMRDAREEVTAALKAAGANSPALAFDAVKGSLAFDKDGKLTNAKDLIDSLKASYPEQFGTPKPADGIDAGTQGTSTVKLTAEKLAKMTPGEIAKLDWEKDVRPVFEAG